MKTEFEKYDWEYIWENIDWAKIENEIKREELICAE